MCVGISGKYESLGENDLLLQVLLIKTIVCERTGGHITFPRLFARIKNLNEIRNRTADLQFLVVVHYTNRTPKYTAPGITKWLPI